MDPIFPQLSSKSAKHLVSIIIPAYNAPQLLRRALRSAVNQTFQTLEVIVVDDGSTESVGGVVRELNDSRITYARQENRGQGAARNFGIALSRGDYVTFLDADDVYLPEKVARQVKFLEAHTEFDICYCGALHFYSPDKRKLLKKREAYPSGHIFRQLLQSSLINLNTAMFRKSVFDHQSFFREGLRGRYGEEWDLYLKLSRAGRLFGYLPEDLVVVEIRQGSNTTWEKQWVIKEHTVLMFEELQETMSDRESEVHELNKILKENRLKLAVAYLLDGKKEESLQVLETLVSKLVFAVAKPLVRVAPARMLRSFLVQLWLLNQRKSFRVVQPELASNSIRLLGLLENDEE